MSGTNTQAEAVERILEGVATAVRYDADRSRKQDPAPSYASRRAYCVGFAELAVDLLRRAGITARTVQGILRTRSGVDGYDSHIGGVYHRWIEIYYPDRGFVFSDPSASINGVDARYIPFGRRDARTAARADADGRRDVGPPRLSRRCDFPATLRVRLRACRRIATRQGCEIATAPRRPARRALRIKYSASA